MIQLAVEQIGLLDGLDINLVGDPVVTLFSHALLPQEPFAKSQLLIFDTERLFVGPVGIETLYKTRFAKEKIEVIYPVQMAFQSFMSVDGKVSGYKRESGAILQAVFKEITYRASRAIVLDG